MRRLKFLLLNVPLWLLSIGIFYLLNGFSQIRNVKPWNNKPQSIPGKIQCELYDTGGEGLAYHDTDSVNNGSGKLNPANGTFLNEFRMNEGVDISYTKSNNIDNNHYNMVEPEMNQLYVGWTKPSEWIRYTVTIKKNARYNVGLKYTCNGDGGISLSLDDKDISGTIHIPSTHNDNDTIPWRQWHHWNYVDSLTTVTLQKGTHVLTLYTKIKGDMNYDFLQFNLINPK